MPRGKLTMNREMPIKVLVALVALVISMPATDAVSDQSDSLASHENFASTQPRFTQALCPSANSAVGPPDLDQAAGWLAIDLPRYNRPRCRQPQLCGLGMGQLVLPSSPTPVACACKDIVSVDRYSIIPHSPSWPPFHFGRDVSCGSIATHS